MTRVFRIKLKKGITLGKVTVFLVGCLFWQNSHNSKITIFRIVLKCRERYDTSKKLTLKYDCSLKFISQNLNKVEMPNPAHLEEKYPNRKKVFWKILNLPQFRIVATLFLLHSRTTSAVHYDLSMIGFSLCSKNEKCSKTCVSKPQKCTAMEMLEVQACKFDQLSSIFFNSYALAEQINAATLDMSFYQHTIRRVRNII